MAGRELNYAETLSQLVSMVGQEVEVGVRGAEGDPPLIVHAGGKLARGGEVYEGELLGYHKDALLLMVGDTMLVLHPDHFVKGIYLEEPGRIGLAVHMGAVAVIFRSGVPPESE